MLANVNEYLYWKTNSDWYDYDENENVYLTNKAPKEAIQSFKKYQKIKEIEHNKDIHLI
jgi:hypothetical protein